MDNPLGDFLNHLSLNQSKNHQWNQQIVIGSPMRVRVHDTTSTGFRGWRGLGKSKSGNDIHFINEVRNPATIGANNKYNALIITERHDLLGTLLWEDTIPYLKLHSDFFHETNPTRVFFYHSWLDINKSNPTPWMNYENQAQRMWECAAAKVNLRYQNQSSNVRVLNLPVGGALVDLVGKITNGDIPGITGSTTARLNVIFSDNVHNTEVGMYYLSILNYIALYGVKPAPTALPSEYNLGVLNQVNTRNALIDQAWNYLHAYYTGPSKQYTMAQCRGFGPAYCTAKNQYDGTAYNGCINDVNYIFTDAMPTWFALPN